MIETVKQRLARDELVMVCGCGRVLHHNMVQMIGIHGGFHAIWFDLEHTGFSFESFEIGTLAARSQGMDSFIRLPPTDYAVITRSIEAGAGGIMAAQIHSAEQAEQVVHWAKFYPRGARGLNGGGYDGRYGNLDKLNLSLAEFCEKSNRESFVSIQIETTGALDQCDAIAAIEDVDLLFIGPADLSQNLGIVGQFDHPRLIEAVDAVAAACKKHGKAWGIVPTSPELADMWVEKGCKMLVPGADVKFINAGIKAVKEAFGKFF